MRALVLERTDEITLRDIETAETLGSRDVRLAVRSRAARRGVRLCRHMPGTSVKVQIELRE